MDLVSVIIPVYNGAATIGETLDSVLQQSYGNLQILVVDDGSTDRTASVVEERRDLRLELLRFPNRGANVSRNRGIQASRGRYLSFLDADDMWSPDKLEKQVAALDAEPRAGVVYSFTRYIDEAGKELHRGYEEPVTGHVLPQLFVRFFLQSGSNALVRREVIERIGGFDESLEVCDDYDFYLRAAEHFPFALVPEHHVHYRVRAGSLSSQAARMRQAAHRVIDQAVARQPEVLGPLKREAIAVTDGYIFGKAIESPREWRNLLLCASCLLNHLKAGRPGLRLLLDRRQQAAYWLMKVTAWLILPRRVRRGIQASLARRRRS